MPPVSPSELALNRVSQQLQAVTDQLIRALFAQSRDSSPGRALRIAELERRRDELHERFAELERWVRPPEARSIFGTSMTPVPGQAPTAMSMSMSEDDSQSSAA